MRNNLLQYFKIFHATRTLQHYNYIKHNHWSTFTVNVWRQRFFLDHELKLGSIASVLIITPSILNCKEMLKSCLFRCDTFTSYICILQCHLSPQLRPRKVLLLSLFIYLIYIFIFIYFLIYLFHILSLPFQFTNLFI